ncbi:MAG: hypothetical protein CMH34_09985 [Microbacterium sp.]|nr:hypothetical protein [Microbacterium sp.]
MADDADVTLALFDGKSKVQLLAGQYRGLDGLRAVVDFDGGRVPAHSTTSYRPEINETVWVAVIDGVAYMLGPTVPKPADGEIVSTSSGIATVSTDVGEVQATYNSGASFSASDQVKLMWGNGCHIVGLKSTSPSAQEVPTAPGGSGERVTKTFAAIDSGSYQPGYGWRINDVWSSANNYGAWFYGTKIRDTVPSSADIIKAEIYLPPPERLTGTRPFGRHPYASKPAGAPTISATSTLSGTSGWTEIPTSLIDHLKSNVGGLGFDLGGWNIWPGTQDPQHGGNSGRLRVTYET